MNRQNTQYTVGTRSIRNTRQTGERTHPARHSLRNVCNFGVQVVHNIRCINHIEIAYMQSVAFRNIGKPKSAGCENMLCDCLVGCKCMFDCTMGMGFFGSDEYFWWFCGRLCFNILHSCWAITYDWHIFSWTHTIICHSYRLYWFRPRDPWNFWSTWFFMSVHYTAMPSVYEFYLCTTTRLGNIYICCCCWIQDLCYVFAYVYYEICWRTNFPRTKHKSRFRSIIINIARQFSTIMLSAHKFWFIGKYILKIRMTFSIMASSITSVFDRDCIKTSWSIEHDQPLFIPITPDVYNIY